MGEVCYLAGGSMVCKSTHVYLQECAPEVHCHWWLPSWSSYSMPSSLVRMPALDRSWGMNGVVSVAVGVTEGQGVLKRGKRLLALREAKTNKKKKRNHAIWSSLILKCSLREINEGAIIINDLPSESEKSLASAEVPWEFSLDLLGLDVADPPSSSSFMILRIEDGTHPSLPSKFTYHMSRGYIKY